MSKRFPIPVFDHEQYKNLEWSAPVLLGGDDQARLKRAAAAGDASAFGSYPIAAAADFYERFKLRGPNLHVRMCLLPAAEVTLVGRSHAWAIQGALLVESIDPARAQVLHEWRTPRPMNTRLGPDDGVTIALRELYVVCSHRYADYWVVNRTAAVPAPDARGFDVLSASVDDANDFHACNLSFRWH